MKSPDSEISRWIITGAPAGYPTSHQVVGEHQIPQLQKVCITDIPNELIAFDDIGRSACPSETGLHFYREDSKFGRFIRFPAAYSRKFSQFKCVLTPDLTLGKEMPRHLRIANTVRSRMCGAALQSRGIKVVPSLRWASPDDYEFVSQGLDVGTVFAVSSYGSFQNGELRFEFERGVRAMLQQLKPEGVMLYGTIREELKLEMQEITTLVQYPINGFRESTSPKPDKFLRLIDF